MSLFNKQFGKTAMNIKLEKNSSNPSQKLVGTNITTNFTFDDYFKILFRKASQKLNAILRVAH